MTFTETHKNVFSLYPKYDLVQCISADFGMGAGIALQFNEELNMKHIMLKNHPGYLKYWQENKLTHDCIYEEGVYNLITKERCFHKPTIKSMRGALMDMKSIVLKDGRNGKIGMPRIGCGLDNMNWEEVKCLVQEVFADTDVDIVVCSPYKVRGYDFDD